MKDSFYFPHDYHARNDLKLVSLSAQGWDLVGFYWAIIEMLHEEGGSLPTQCEGIAHALRATPERISLVINFPGLFEIKDGIFRSKRVDENLKRRQEIREKAQKSAQKRWKNANAMPTQCEGNAIKERKGKERKGKEIKERIVTIPPTFEEVSKYCMERKNRVDAQKWFDHYQAKGWFIGNSKMKDWRAAVRTWEREKSYLTKAQEYGIESMRKLEEELNVES